MHRFLPSFTAICLLLTSTLHAQVVTITPSFANQTDMVTITFDASQGNGALNGVSQVYAHTGVITNFSSSPTDWQHVQGTWGTPDPIVQMTNIGNNRHQIQYQIDNFYGVSGGEVVEALAFVFRNADGSLVGRSSDGSDIFVPLFNGDFGARITSPEEDPLFVELTDTIHFSGETSDSATIKLYHEDSLLMQVNGSSLAADIPVAPFGAGKFWLRMVAERDTHVVVDSIYYLVRAPVALGIPPAGIEDGINYVDGSTVILQLYAPNKDFIYVIGDFNNWEADPQYYMNKHISLPIYWLEITGLTPGEEYAFQYMIDDELMRVADVHADKILDPWNDGFISATTYPNLKPYPAGKTSNIVSILQTEQVPYPWDTTFTYTRPDQENLVVYELLIRDFVDESTYQTLIDTLAYFERLGINAIELMPVNEFEGNDSWGYNPDFYFAPDKYYGTEEKFKEFIEECHRRGIAVIMDIALNHSFGLSPQVRMYFDPTAGPFGEPTANSPWFNPTARHDFNVGYDYNHESDRTRDFVDRVLAYWVEEYQIDGYRLDLSKGFTQNNTLGNIGAWNALDQSRINNLTRIANELWADHPGTYMILEHFADNSEETVLADAGFLLWGNGNHEYTEGALGFSSNMNWQSYQERGWQDAHVVSYMESHDEERMVYKNINFGNSQGNYNVKDPRTALRRAELAATLFFPIPGPKMFWQFGEVGYDFSINRCTDGTIAPNCRLSRKPIRWDYLQDPDRFRLFRVFSTLIELKTTHPTFQTTDFAVDLSSVGKRIHLNHDSMDVTILGNFDVEAISINPGFQETGTWYEYFTGEQLDVLSVSAPIELAPGEYRMYTNVELPGPDIPTSVNAPQVNALDLQVFPNPARESVTFAYTLDLNVPVQLLVYDLTGRPVANLASSSQGSGRQQLTWDGRNEQGQLLPGGVYLYRLTTGEAVTSGNLVLTR